MLASKTAKLYGPVSVQTMVSPILVWFLLKVFFLLSQATGQGQASPVPFSSSYQPYREREREQEASTPSCDTTGLHIQTRKTTLSLRVSTR